MSVKLRIALTVACLLLAVSGAYIFQFLWAAMHKGETKTDYAWETLAQETLSRQLGKLPQMRISDARLSPHLCDFLNFEGFWGTCVSIGLDVRGYRPEYKSLVEREVMRLAEQMRMPCRLLLDLGLPDEANLFSELGCSAGERQLKLRILISSVIVANEEGPRSRPNRWFTKNREYLYSYNFR